MEDGETLEDAAVREAHEVLGLEVQLGALLAVVRFKGTTQYYYQAHATGGTFGSGRGEELAFGADAPNGTYTPCWLPVAGLDAYDVRPRLLADALAEPESRVSSWPLIIGE